MDKSFTQTIIENPMERLESLESYITVEFHDHCITRYLYVPMRDIDRFDEIAENYKKSRK